MSQFTCHGFTIAPIYMDAIKGAYISNMFFVHIAIISPGEIDCFLIHKANNIASILILTNFILLLEFIGHICVLMYYVFYNNQII